jgi:DnaJ-class molecular chaperone
VAAWNVGGAAHNGVMNNMDTCERCEGSGADPMQAFYEDVVTLCLECRGDGVVLALEYVREEELVRLSA